MYMYTYIFVWYNYARGDKMLKTSDAQRKATAKYQNNQDHIRVHVPKGKKDEYKAHAQSKGMSLNAYIIGLIEADTKKEQGE